MWDLDLTGFLFAVARFREGERRRNKVFPLCCFWVFTLSTLSWEGWWDVWNCRKVRLTKTDLDVPPAFRNDVLRSKKVLIGCGGGYHQECSQPYSPVAKWIEKVDVAQ